MKMPIAIAVLLSACSTDLLEFDYQVVTVPIAIGIVFADGTSGQLCGPTACVVPAASRYTLEERAEIVARVAGWYAPFGIPVAEGHHALRVLITATLAPEVGFAANIGGIAPFKCQPQIEGQATAFGDIDIASTAYTVAQESAHILGLAHVSNVNDLMFPTLPNPGEETSGFIDEDSPTMAPNCERKTQNSAAMLRAVVASAGIQ